MRITAGIHVPTTYLGLGDSESDTLHVNMIEFVVREWKPICEAAFRRSGR